MSRKICRTKKSLLSKQTKNKIISVKKYPLHLFEKNGKVWLLNKKNKNLYCLCDATSKTNKKLKGNPSYSQCKYNGKYQFNHRVLYEVFNNTIPKNKHVDHKNGKRKDNSKSNLRLLSKSQNMQNRRKSLKNASSKFKGVSFSRSSKRPWRARIKLNGKDKYLGRFDSQKQAFEAYKKEARKQNQQNNAQFKF